MKIVENGHFNLEKVKSPKFLKNLDYFSIDILKEDIRNYIINNVSQNGGHLSSNLGVIEATIALCRIFDFPRDKIIFDVGHQCYTYKILTGRSLKNLRQENGISGFQKISESNYDAFEAGHSSTSIAVANGFAIDRDNKNEKYNIIAFIGDSSIANGLSFESLNNLESNKHKIIIILNDNDMSITKAVGNLSVLFKKQYKDIESYFNSFDLDYIGPINGHNIKELENSLKKAKNNNKSIVIHIKTNKGNGYKYAENDLCGLYHGISKFNVSSGQEINPLTFSWAKCYSQKLLKLMSSSRIYTIYPATGFGSDLLNIKDKFPKRCIDVGISEEYAITISGGLSVNGNHPVICMYSTFLQRCYDQICHDLARINLNATILIDRCGLIGNDGDSHQGIYDESFLYTIPNTVITMASNSGQCDSLLKESINKHGVFAIRYPKENAIFSKEEKVKFGKWIIENKSINHKLCIISFGPLLNEIFSLLTNNKLNREITLINAIYQKPLDLDLIKKTIKSFDNIIIYNPYSTENGFANALISLLSEYNFKGNIYKKCIPCEFIKEGKIFDQLSNFKLLPNDIIQLANRILNK